MRFIPAYNNPEIASDPSEPFGSSWISQAYGVERNDNNIDGFDYVICNLVVPLGNTCGWMGTQLWDDDDNYTNRRWISVGYPGDSFSGQVPMVEMDVPIDDVDDDGDGKKLKTDQEFASKGWSGGPLWNFIEPGQPYAVGVMSGWEDTWVLWWGSIDDFSAGGSRMVNLVKWAQVNWPA